MNLVKVAGNGLRLIAPAGDYNRQTTPDQLLSFPNDLRFTRKRAVSCIGQIEGVSRHISTDNCELRSAAFRDLLMMVKRYSADG